MSAISVEEELSFMSLTSMFEKVAPEKILEVLRNNHFDVELSIDELLVLPEPSSQPVDISSSISQSTDLIDSFEFVDEHPVLTPTTDDTSSPQSPSSESLMDASTLSQPESLATLSRRKLSGLQLDVSSASSYSIFSPSIPRRDDLIPSPSSSLQLSGSLLSSELDTRPSSIIESDRETELLKRIADLEAANARLESEKTSRMRFMMTQIDELKSQLSERDQRVDRMQLELEQLHTVLRESKQQENRLQQLLQSSRHVLIDGIQSFSRNVTEVTEKVQREAHDILGRSSDDKEFKIIQTMRELATTIRDEIKGAFKSGKRVDIQTQPISEPDENTDEPEDPEFLQAQQASMATFALEQQQQKCL